MTPERIFDGDLIRADVFQPGKPRLIVTFRQRVARPGHFDAPRPTLSFTGRGYAHLHLQSLRNDWYVNAETEALEDCLAAFARPYRRVVAMGFSMGAYAAFRYSRALRLMQVIAVSPQVSVAPSVVPFDRRYRSESAGFDPERGDLARHGAAELGGALLYDPLRPMDRVHARMLGEIFPQLRLCRLAGGGHPATQVLTAGGRFGQLQRQLFRGPPDPAAIVALHRATRHGSPVYRRHIADALRLRAGRTGTDAPAGPPSGP
ncbi:alpha/beta hydrolase [Roseisalinus antarcticus]|uniref:Alpha/beta hydrolase family protein n=1 Tax=Roseisalinus antarcticus TaxID=254357 RepID=A0A1Y5RT09_9RHOB|nr:alpha/beta hydrolase [Roseisalinus antarcticus]SLN24487.1 hypothetical protein ROA7023_00756 [Roseisalinus antarcticus]